MEKFDFKATNFKIAKIGSRKRKLQTPQKTRFVFILQGLKFLLNFNMKKLDLKAESFKIAKIGSRPAMAMAMAT